MSKCILSSSAGAGVVRLTLNAPDRLNPLSDEMLAVLEDRLRHIASDGSIRVVILAGAGKAFCAGHDLKEMTAKRKDDDGGRAAFRDLFERCSRLMLFLNEMPQPVIAQVHGLAAAAGCQLVASCDLAVASEDTVFGVNGVNIGLFCSTPMVALTRNIPRKQAFEMLTTGNFIPATRARELGLINRVTHVEDLASKTEELAQEIASKLGAAIRIGKRAFYDQLALPVKEAYAFTGDVMVANMAIKETEEGIQAFLEKRPPDWPEDS